MIASSVSFIVSGDRIAGVRSVHTTSCQAAIFLSAKLVMVIALDADVRRTIVGLRHILAGTGSPGVKCPRTHSTTC